MLPKVSIAHELVTMELRVPLGPEYICLFIMLAIFTAIVVVSIWFSFRGRK